ncbi:MAG: glycosyltransferase family 39 protein [Sedimentisphaerales bacterium]|nr:glycosyltransferase family 39 protein [Sedimentisphaerales bacterium]
MKHENLIMVLLLALLCLNLRIVNFVGIGINDDIAYIQNARTLAQGDSPISSGFNQLGFRLGMVFPLALLYNIFGYNEVGFSLYPIICSIITCALIYLTAVRLWGTAAGVFACLLWIAYPLQIVFGTQLSPSNQHATCVAAALFLYFYATTRKTSSSPPALFETDISRFDFLKKLKEPTLLMFCGICIGLGWMINAIFVTIVLVILPFLFIVRPKIKYLLWITAGFVLIIFLELLVVKISCGSWFARFSCILRTEEAVKSNTDYSYLPRALFKIWNTNPLNDEGHFGIIWYVFIIITIAAIFLKEKTATALALGCWLWLAYIQWGGKLVLGEPIAKYIRYFSMIVPLQCLAFGAILWRLTNFSKMLSKMVIFLFVVLLIHSSWLGIKAVKAVKMHTRDFKEITRFFMNMDLEDDEIIYTDNLTGNFLKLYSKGTLNIKRINFKEVVFPERGFLVADGSWYAIALPEYRNGMPEWSLAPPSYWPLLHTVCGKKVGIYGSFDPKIYKIEPENSYGGGS